MCQYMCDPVASPGVPHDWHLAHLGSFAIGGAGLVMTEATSVAPEGRISPEDTGIWNDVQQEAWARIVAFVHTQGRPVGIQLAHAGRKASTWRTWSSVQGTVPRDLGGWPTIGPTSEPFPGLEPPSAMTADDVRRVVADFVAAADRADKAGFDVAEIHAAHGYLLHQFLSPLVNTRDDDWGGDQDGRSAVLLAVVEAVRERWPDAKPLFVRISATDWAEGGWTVDASCRLAVRLRERGVDLIDCSSGGAIGGVAIPVAPGYQVPLAAAVRATGIATSAVGRVTAPTHVEGVLAAGAADAVMMGRAFLRNPRWVQAAAAEFGMADTFRWPDPYHTASPHG